MKINTIYNYFTCHGDVVAWSHSGRLV